LGSYCSAMLAKFPTNAVLALLSSTLGAATLTLTATQSAYAEAVTALIPLRVAVKYMDYVSDKTVRAVLLSAEIADGEKNGKIARAVFPDGVTPIVRPVGQTQCDQMRALEGRLEAAASIWPDALVQKAK